MKLQVTLVTVIDTGFGNLCRPEALDVAEDFAKEISEKTGVSFEVYDVDPYTNILTGN